CLELADGLPKAVVLEQQPGLQVLLGEPEIGIDRHRPRIDVHAYRTRQQSRTLLARESSPRRHEDQLMGIVANGRCRQALHESLAVVSYALLDRNEEVALLLEAVLEMLEADDLYGLDVDAAPVRSLVSDDFRRRKVDRGHLTSEPLGRRSTDRRNACILI